MRLLHGVGSLVQAGVRCIDRPGRMATSLQPSRRDRPFPVRSGAGDPRRTGSFPRRFARRTGDAHRTRRRPGPRRRLDSKTCLRAEGSGNGRPRSDCGSKTSGWFCGRITKSTRPSLSRSPAARPRPRSGTWKAGPARSVTSTSLRPPSAPAKSCAGIRCGTSVRIIVDMAVGRHQIEPAIVVEIEKGDPEPEPVAAWHREAVLRGMVAEDAVAQVLVEGRVFVVEVGDGQVGQAVAVQVAAGDAHARLVDTRRRCWRRRQRGRPPRSGGLPDSGTGTWPIGRWRRRGRRARHRQGRSRQPRAPRRSGRGFLPRSRYRRNARRRCGRGDRASTEIRAARKRRIRCELCPSKRAGARCPTRGNGKRRDRGRRRRRGPRRPPRSASRGHPQARPCSVMSSNVPSPLLRKRA